MADFHEENLNHVKLLWINFLILDCFRYLDRMGEGPKVYNPKPADQFYGKGTLNTEGPFTDVRQRVAPGLFQDIDRYDILKLF